MNTCTASGIAARTWRAPCTSISSTTDLPSREPPLDLRAQGPVAVAAVGGVLEELAVPGAAVELLAVEEVVVAAVPLAVARLPGGRRDRQLELRDPPQQLGDQRSLADPGRPGDHEDLRHRAESLPTNGARVSVDEPTVRIDARAAIGATGRSRRRSGAGYRRSCETSSPRWRCERPPIVFDGEIRHWVRILFAFTRPYFGTARIMSNAFADSTYSGGSSSSDLDLGLARLQVPLQLGPPGADLVGPLQRPHPLLVGALGNSGGGVDGGGHRRRRSYTRFARRGKGVRGLSRQIRFDLRLRSTPPIRPSSVRARAPDGAASEPPASSARTRGPAIGSRKFAVPTATAVAPAARNASASAPDSIPPMPITGTDDRGRHPTHLAERVGRGSPGPRAPRCPPPARRRACAGPSAVASSVLISDSASAPPARPPAATVAGLGDVRRQLHDQRLGGQRAHRLEQAPASPSGCWPTISPDSTLGQETFSSSAATSGRSATPSTSRCELVVAACPSPRRSAAPASSASSGRSCSRNPSRPLFGRPIELIIPAGVSKIRGGGFPARGSGVIVFETKAENGNRPAGRRRRPAGRRSRRTSRSR